MRRISLFALFVSAALSVSAARCQVPNMPQGFAPSLSWHSWPGTYHPNDNTPFSHRYSYGAGAVPFCGGGNMLYMEYLDRIDRAEKFGYQLPPPPDMTPPCCQPRMGFGVGFFQRIR
jgi:hypothetical protein